MRSQALVREDLISPWAWSWNMVCPQCPREKAYRRQNCDGKFSAGISEAKAELWGNGMKRGKDNTCSCHEREHFSASTNGVIEGAQAACILCGHHLWVPVPLSSQSVKCHMQRTSASLCVRHHTEKGEIFRIFRSTGKPVALSPKSPGSDAFAIRSLPGYRVCCWGVAWGPLPLNDWWSHDALTGGEVQLAESSPLRMDWDHGGKIMISHKRLWGSRIGSLLSVVTHGCDVWTPHSWKKYMNLSMESPHCTETNRQQAHPGKQGLRRDRAPNTSNPVLMSGLWRGTWAV